MNEFEIPSAMQLERLVDGELSESERCAVLMAFNQEECAESCGWRRLAIAFLEAQILREAFQQGDLAGISRLCEVEPVLHPPISPATARRKSTVSRTSNVTGSWWFGLVACCLLAFGIGYFIAIPEALPTCRPRFLTLSST